MKFEALKNLIINLDLSSISEERKLILNELIKFIQKKKDSQSHVNLNFICTHNSRRSHLSQIWAQTMANHYKISNVFCYSGGTEATAMYNAVSKTLKNQGFHIQELSLGQNPVYAIKYAVDTHPIVCFSKTFDNDFNPDTNFAAIMTCTHADENCPFISGAEQRIPIRYDDPKAYDGTAIQLKKYAERSLQIAMEMKYIFSKINL